MVGEIGASAVAGEEAFGEIGIGREEADGVVLVVEEPEDVESVVVLGREAMLWREAVVDGEDDGGDAAGEAAAYGVVGERGVAEEGKAYAVEEYEDGKGGGVGRRGEDANREVAGGIDDDVEGEDAMDGLDGIGGGFEIEEAEEAAVDCAVGASGEVAAEGGDGNEETGFPWQSRGFGRRGRRRRRGRIV